MLFWIKCLLAFYDTSIIIEPLIPLYLYHTAGLDFLECAGVMAALHLLSLVGTAYWTKLIENEYYPLVMALFSIMGIISYIALFILEGWMLLIYIVLNGLFYQPLQVLMDAVVIKILGDFRVLFYGKKCILMKHTILTF
jgi:hypothetical protein